jgi:heptosyltransferase-1
MSAAPEGKGPQGASPRESPEADDIDNGDNATDRRPSMSGVLVVRPSSLGDIVHALALVCDVKANRPELAVDWVAEEAFAALPALHPQVRRVVPVALRRWRRQPFEPSTWREMRAFRRDLSRERYDAVLDLQEQMKGALIAALARGRRHGPDRASIREAAATLLHDVHHPIDPSRHFVDRCRALAAAALGYRVEGPPRYGLVAPPPAHDDAAPRGPYVVFFHATSRADKRWPDAHWRDLAGARASARFAVLLPWGTQEERATSERIAADEAAAIVPPRQSLPALASVIARAHGVVGVDTGLVHLAAALSTPTVALFTSTDAALAGVAVAGAHARDLGGNGVVPSPAEVRRALGELMRAAPRC